MPVVSLRSAFSGSVLNDRDSVFQCYKPTARPCGNAVAHASSFASCNGPNQSNLIHTAREKQPAVSAPKWEDDRKRKEGW